MTSNESLPNWLSITDNKVTWTNECESGVYHFISHIKAGNVESIAGFITTLTIA
jgi:hypothetical protein